MHRYQRFPVQAVLLIPYDTVGGQPISTLRYNSFERTLETATGHKELDELVRQIMRIVSPVQVIVFGSMARRQASDSSDMDLLVVVQDSVHRRMTSQAIYRHVKGVSIPFDIIVATASDVRLQASNIGLVLSRALTEGVTIYDSRARIS